MRIIIIILLASLFLLDLNAQESKLKLTDEYRITYKDFLDLKLQILSTQISCGSHKIIDMGTLNFPVTIRLNEHNEILFEIVGEINSDYSKEIHQEIIIECFEFVDVSIRGLLRRNFPIFENVLTDRIVGCWIYKESQGYLPHAKWINSKFEWITY